MFAESALKYHVVVGLAVFFFVVSCSSRNSRGTPESWDPLAAASYLDQREAQWAASPSAARDHGTFCVSCHSGLPYAMAWPTLRRFLGELSTSSEEAMLLENIRKRVRLWSETEPLYRDQGSDPKSAESRGSESVINALILSVADTETGRLSQDARTALVNMWAEQQTTGPERGAWQWLRFDLEPWEGADSEYYGAALAALAAGSAPEGYFAEPEIQGNLASLGEYLRREYYRQSTLNRAVLLWASTKLAGVLDATERDSVVEEILDAQADDGGWRLAPLTFDNLKGWKRLSIPRAWFRWDGIPVGRSSDGYATGLMTLVLQEAGVRRDHPQLGRALSWLSANQSETDGSWRSYSLNAERDLSSHVGRFMSDAATAYAVLALTYDSLGETTAGR